MYACFLVSIGFLTRMEPGLLDHMPKEVQTAYSQREKQILNLLDPTFDIPNPPRSPVHNPTYPRKNIKRIKIKKFKKNPPTNVQIQRDISLECFDEECVFEIQGIVEMVASAKAAGHVGLGALSKVYDIFHSDWKWEECHLIGYADNKYLIQWTNGAQKWVTRFNLLLQTETKDRYFLRIERAVKEKAKWLDNYERECLILNTQLSNMAPLPLNLKLGSLKRVGREFYKYEFKIVKECLEEIEKDYAYSMKKAKLLLSDNNAKRLSDPVVFGVQEFLESAHAPVTQHKQLMGNILTRAKNLSDYMFVADRKLHSTLSCIYKEINTLQGTNIFLSTRLSSLIDFSDFQEIANLHIEQKSFYYSATLPKSIRYFRNNIVKLCTMNCEIILTFL
jgi:hypothetical protein